MADEHEDWTPYQKMEAGILKDISCDTDRIIDMMEGKDMGEGFDSGALMGMLANKGIDPGVVAMLNNCKKDGWGDNGMLIVLFLILILGFGGGNGGWFGRNGAGEAVGIDRTIFNQSNFDALNNAINTAGTRQEMAINQLASNLNCSVGQIQNAIYGLDKQLALTNGNVVNAVQQCCCTLQGKIQDCCCAMQRAIENQGCQTREAISGLSFQLQTADAATRQLMQTQHCETINTIKSGFANLELRDLQRDLDNKNQMISDLKSRLSQEQQTTAILQAIRGMDTIAFTGTAGTTAVSGTGTIS